jgi:RNA polymerase sigma factor (sigma-70 family)
VATAELVRRYLPHVRAAVRRRLATSMRIRFDSQDFAQDVWLSFFRAALDREDLRDEGGLVAYLSEMARLKVAEEYRHQTTQKVGLTRAVSFSETNDPTGREPTPSETVLADDEWERLTAGLPDRERRMLQMLRDGHTHADTAATFQLSEKTVQRLVRRLLSRGAAPEAPQ